MLAKTHIAFGILLALLILPFIKAGNNLLFITIAVIGSILPDIDERHSMISSNIPVFPALIGLFVKHRGIFHSIFLAVFIAGLIWYFASPIYSTALFIGYISHLLMDSLTTSGINFLHPLTNLHLSGFIETGSYKEFILLFLIIGGILIKIT